MRHFSGAGRRWHQGRRAGGPRPRAAAARGQGARLFAHGSRKVPAPVISFVVAALPQRANSLLLCSCRLLTIHQCCLRMLGTPSDLRSFLASGGDDTPTSLRMLLGGSTTHVRRLLTCAGLSHKHACPLEPPTPGLASTAHTSRNSPDALRCSKTLSAPLLRCGGTLSYRTDVASSGQALHRQSPRPAVWGGQHGRAWQVRRPRCRLPGAAQGSAHRGFSPAPQLLPSRTVGAAWSQCWARV